MKNSKVASQTLGTYFYLISFSIHLLFLKFKIFNFFSTLQEVSKKPRHQENLIFPVKITIFKKNFIKWPNFDFFFALDTKKNIVFTPFLIEFDMYLGLVLENEYSEVHKKIRLVLHVSESPYLPVYREK